MHNVPILVISCDRYADVWRPFFTTFFRRWPDCPFPVHLGTNFKTYDDPSVRAIPVGDDLSWASGLASMLDALDSEYVLLFLEDFFITNQVDTNRVVELVDLARRRRSGCLRLIAGRPLALAPTAPLPGHPGVGILAPGELWRVSAQVAVWRTDVLRRLLVPGLDAWKFEVLGTQLSERFEEEFLGVYEPAIPYIQGIEKGKWTPDAVALLAAAGETVDLDTRPLLGDVELARHHAANEATSEENRPKLEAISLFLAGRRAAAVREWKRYWRRHPRSFDAYVVLFTGLLGPAVLRFARARWVDLRLSAVRFRFARKVKSRLSMRSA